jgi:hypothetical protein
MMATSPRFKIYASNGEYVAACKFAEDAGAVVASYDGGTIRLGHRRIVWREGSEIETAANSYDAVAQTIYARIGK